MKKLLSFLFIIFCCGVIAGEAKLSNLSLSALDWDIPNVIPWGWTENAVFNYTSGDYIFSRNTPYSKEAACEFVIVLNEKLSKNGRAEVALVLCDKNRRNRYLFGPVVEKDGSTKIELKLFINGKYVNGKGCKIKYSGGKNLKWEYKTEYRFRLVVKNGIAVGSVFDKEDKKLAELSSVLDDSIKESAIFPMRTALYTHGMTAKFSNAKAAFCEEIKMPEAKVVEPLPYTVKAHAPSVKGKKTGFFHVEQLADGKWWIIDPNGYGFYANGMDAIYYKGNFCEALGYSPYFKNIKDRFPTVEKWSEHIVKRLTDLGFNFIGTGEPALRKKMAYAINMMFGSSFAAFGDDYNITPYKGKVNTALPNVFHPRFQEYCERKLANNKSRLNDPYCLGIFSDNELRWNGQSLHPDGSGVFDSVMEKKKTHSAKIALINFLTERYNNNIDKFNESWGLQLKDFKDIQDLKKLPHNTDEALAAKQDFLYLVADTYFGKIKKAMQNAAPNHMYIGCRSAGITSAHEKVWRASGNHCDIVSINQYPVMDFDKNEIYVHITGESMEKAFGRMYEWTKRPLMITEWSFLSMDSGLPNTRGAGQRVRTQKERAIAGEMFLQSCMSLPYMVGHNFYMYLDYPELGARKTHPEDGNYGLVNSNDDLYELMAEMFKKNQAGDPAILRNKPVPSPKSSVVAGNIYKKLKSDINIPAAANSKNIAEKNGSGFTLSNGILKLVNNGKDADVEVYYKDKLVGKYNFMARFLGKNASTIWEDAVEISNVKVYQNAATWIEAEVKSSYFSFKTKIILPEDSNYFMTEVTEISNPNAESSLILEGIYFRAYADFEIDFSQNHRYYDKYAYWLAKDKSIAFGGMASGARVAYYYHGEQANQHPDGFFMYRQTLTPEQTVKLESPCYAFTFVADSENMAKQTIEKVISEDLGL